ncbi:MAG TPA: hypothetical protein VM736_14210 [Gemmatimonadales bacterium]|nr:hypothetical protein [Gemmatimonadales bacterium]
MRLDSLCAALVVAACAPGDNARAPASPALKYAGTFEGRSYSREADTGAQIVCTTECFLDGYAIADKRIPLPAYRALGEPIPAGTYYRRLAALAAEMKIRLVAGMTEADGEARYNTASSSARTGT